MDKTIDEKIEMEDTVYWLDNWEVLECKECKGESFRVYVGDYYVNYKCGKCDCDNVREK